jgi:prepilin-type N-terminal cleavage/methylation domain-containing protein
MNFRSDHNSRGFTLIEIIVTLVIIAVMGTMTYTYFGQAFSESVNSISRLKNSTDLHKIMENITADYNKYPKWRSSSSYPVNTIVIPTNVNGRCYKIQTCTGSCQSSVSEPTTWPLTSAPTVNDGTITWELCTTVPPCSFSNGKVHDANSLLTLQSKIGTADSSLKDNDYGGVSPTTRIKYYVTENKFIKFTATGNETDDFSGANEILKVTIKNDTGETLTALFMSDYSL